MSILKSIGQLAQPSTIFICLAVIILILQEIRLHKFMAKNYNNNNHDESVERREESLDSSSPKKTLRFTTTSNTNNNDVTSILWEDMTQSQRDEAYGIVLPYLKELGKNMGSRANQGKGRWKLNSFYWSCDAKETGGGWSGHYLCHDMLEKVRNDTCQFISFGISNAHSFETHLAREYGCHGFSADPTVSYPSNILTNVTFNQMGAGLLNPNEEQVNNNNDGQQPWFIANVPLLKKALGIKHLHVLKMDCEGCEYGLARDVIKDDPTFFNHIDQVALETHTARQWLNTTETVYYYGVLMKLLSNAGLILQDVRAASCAPVHTATGCWDDIKFLCGNPNRCQSYLFARYDNRTIL